MKGIIPIQLTFLIAVLVLATGYACNSSSSTQKLSTASDAVAHALLDAQTAAQQAVASGVISAGEYNDFNAYLVKTAQAGQVLDTAIKQGQSASSVADKANLFLAAFNQLQQQGLVGIKNAQLKLALSSLMTSAETSVAVIIAATGGK